VKDPREPRTWTNREIEANSEGYKAAQSAYAEDREEAERARREADDLEHFEAAFVEAGGKRFDAAEAFREQCTRQAAQAAQAADAAAMHTNQRRIRQAL
jgi:hypothetical protein